MREYNLSVESIHNVVFQFQHKLGFDRKNIHDKNYIDFNWVI